MGTPQARIEVDGTPVLLLGTIAGFVPDGERVRQAYEAFRPKVVALGIPPEDLPTLTALAAGGALPDLEPDVASSKLLELLQPFGATRIPSPDLEASHAAASTDGVGLVALDLDDEAHAALFTKTVGFLHVLRSNAIQSRLLKKGIGGADAYALAANWDAAWTKPKGLARVEAAREQHMAQRLREAVKGGPVLAVVPSVRLAGIVAHLTTPEARPTGH